MGMGKALHILPLSPLRLFDGSQPGRKAAKVYILAGRNDKLISRKIMDKLATAFLSTAFLSTVDNPHEDKHD